MAYLEPSHDHDPSFVVHLIEPPKQLTDLLPKDVIDTLESVQDATSIVYASKARFEDLVADRFERLLPEAVAKYSAANANAAGSLAQDDSNTDVEKPCRPSYSEPAFFHYQNQVKAEKHYLTKESLVDWHNKTRRLELNVRRLQLSEADDHMFHAWLEPLKREVIKWEDTAEETDVPDFESTVAELGLKHVEASMADLAYEVKEAIGSVAMEKTDSGIGM